MKKILRFLKWTGLVFLSILITVSILTASRHLKFDAPYPEIRASQDAAVIVRGKHLVIAIAHCMDCHSRTNGDSLLNLHKEVPLSGSVGWAKYIQTVKCHGIL